MLKVSYFTLRYLVFMYFDCLYSIKLFLLCAVIFQLQYASIRCICIIAHYLVRVSVERLLTSANRVHAVSTFFDLRTILTKILCVVSAILYKMHFAFKYVP